MKMLRKFEQVIFSTDPVIVAAIHNNDFKTLRLLPRVAWAIRLLNLGGCKFPRIKRKFK